MGFLEVLVHLIAQVVSFLYRQDPFSTSLLISESIATRAGQ
jgi:hypothetical protein